MKTFRQYVENLSYNRDLLNNMMKKFNRPGLLWGRDVNLDPAEIAEVENVLNQARDKVTAVINQPQYRKMWNDFQIWEKQHGVNLVRFSWPNKVVQNGGNIPEVQAGENKVVVPEALYNILSWQVIGKGIRSIVDGLKKTGGQVPHESQYYGTSAMDFAKKLVQLSHLVKAA